MERGVFESTRHAVLFVFTRAELSKILRRLRCDMSVEFNQDSSYFRIAHRDVEEHHRIIRME